MFLADYRDAVSQAYPAAPYGTVLPFRRVFVVATRALGTRVRPGVSGTCPPAQTSNAANHTYEMEQDNLKPVGHTGFIVDAQAMAALLHSFATHAEYRAAVKKEFDGVKALFGDSAWHRARLADLILPR